MSQVLATARRVVVLEDLVDHGNVGAVFRCAAAFGADAVILSPRCADPLYRRAVKVSMGAVFAVPYARMTDWYGGLGQLRGGRTSGCWRSPRTSQPRRSVPRCPPGRPRRSGSRCCSAVRATGCPRRWMREADEAVCIPMSPPAMALGVDSLNVVAAAAVACHALAMH